MNKRLIIIGAGGHGRVALDIAKKIGDFHEIMFLDDAEIKDKGITVVGKVSDYSQYIESSVFFVAIGNNFTRRRIQTELRASGAKIISLIHPDAVICEDVQMADGCIVMAGTVINTGSTIGEGVIINTGSTIDHDCIIGNYAHISVGAHLAGSVEIGECTFVCAGVTVINNIRICEECTIGAGAVVVNDIVMKGLYIGMPAKYKNVTRYKNPGGGVIALYSFLRYCLPLSEREAAG